MYHPRVSMILRFFRNVVAVVAGLLVAGLLVLVGRQLASGNGIGPSPRDLSAAAQLIVALTWAIAAAVGGFLAALISRRPLPPLIVVAWLFQMVWLSPGVRPAELTMRLVCAIALALAGFAGMALYRYRMHSLHQLSDPATR